MSPHGVICAVVFDYVLGYIYIYLRKFMKGNCYHKYQFTIVDFQ